MENMLETDELLALAKLDIEAGKLESALVKLKTVVNNTDTPAEGYLVAARLYATLRLFDKSQQQYELFIKAEPNNTLGQFELGMTLFDSSDVNGALDHWGAILKDNRTHPPGLFYSALAHSRLGDNAEAKSHLDILLKSVPADNMYFQKGKELGLAIDMQLEKENKPKAAPMAYSEEASANGEITH